MEQNRLKYLKCEIVIRQDDDGYCGSVEEFPGLTGLGEGGDPS